MKITLFCN